MGCMQSKQGLLVNTDGDGKDFLDRYSVDRIVGQGEFGIVKIVYSKLNDEKMERPIACKMLRKGMQFKDNTLYSPINPRVLQTECGILQKLGGRHHTLKLYGVFESPSTIYILTEFLEGGDMFEYISKYYGFASESMHREESPEDSPPSDLPGLRTEDVSRMSYQLLDALNHCAKNGIIHRDIKPENIMFKKAERGSSLKLIDFGAGTFCATSIETATNKKGNRRITSYDLSHPMPPDFNEEEGTNQYEPSKIRTARGDQLHLHTTFAGSALYMSPEMFRKHYTVMTDVWSVGVTLYVLVAGYPADALQEAFNIFHNNKRTIDTLKKLPNMPENMPETFFEMLDCCLTYKHRLRKSARTILETSEFVKFHKDYEETEDEDNKDVLSLTQILSSANARHRTKSIVIEGSVARHAVMRKYGKFERAVTSLLATVLLKAELKSLLNRIDNYIDTHEEEVMEAYLVDNRKLLQVIPIAALCTILNELEFDDLIPKIEDLSRGEDYSKYAYHVAYLRDFYTVRLDDGNASAEEESDHSLSALDNSISRRWKVAIESHQARKTINSRSSHPTEPNNSDNEEGGEERKFSSIHNGNAWDIISKRVKKEKQPRRPSI